MSLVPSLALFGLAFVLTGIAPRPCSAFLWKHGMVTVASSPLVPLATVAPVASIATTAAAPSYVAPMYYSIPGYTHYAAVAPTYYTPAYSPATAAYLAPSLPVAPMSFLATFNPDAPMVAGTPGYHPALPQARGTRILQGLRDAVLANPGLLSASLIQLAANLFGQEFGFSPNPQDISILTGLVTKVLDELKGMSASTPAAGPVSPNGGAASQPASNQGSETLVITVTLPASSRVLNQQPGQGGQKPQGGQQGGSPGGPTAGGPGANQTGTSGGPGKP
jgi:hypothetical protein